MDDRVAFGPDWLLWRDFAVRSAGFPVGGLDVFGPGDEPARLRAAAGDPAFREAMTWQNAAAMANALDKLGDAPGTSKTRRREDVVASYWQRYCAKNDTIGFYGPLAWGRIEADGAPRLAVRSGPVVRERGVHLESWGVQAVAAAVDPELRVPLGPRSEDDLRSLFEAHPDAGVRERGLAALARLEAARDALAGAPRAQLGPALAALDATFTELTGARSRHAQPGPRIRCAHAGLSGLPARLSTSTLGRPFLDDVAPAVTAVFEAVAGSAGASRRSARRSPRRSPRPAASRSAPSPGRCSAG